MDIVGVRKGRVLAHFAAEEKTRSAVEGGETILRGEGTQTILKGSKKREVGENYYCKLTSKIVERLSPCKKKRQLHEKEEKVRTVARGGGHLSVPEGRVVAQKKGGRKSWWGLGGCVDLLGGGLGEGKDKTICG